MTWDDLFMLYAAFWLAADYLAWLYPVRVRAGAFWLPAGFAGGFLLAGAVTASVTGAKWPALALPWTSAVVTLASAQLKWKEGRRR